MGNDPTVIMGELCEVKGCDKPVIFRHIEKKDGKDTGKFRHICEFHYEQIKDNGLEPEYEAYIDHDK